MALIYITCASEEEAVKISRRLLDKRFIACANIHPIRSLYRWQGKMQDEKEFVVMAKTKHGIFNKIKQEVRKIHSYDVPCILKIDAEANEEYSKWVDEELNIKK